MEAESLPEKGDEGTGGTTGRGESVGGASGGDSAMTERGKRKGAEKGVTLTASPTKEDATVADEGIGTRWRTGHSLAGQLGAGAAK